MNELIKYFNNKYSKTYGKIAYPRTTIQIYRVYQAIKSYGIMMINWLNCYMT